MRPVTLAMTADQHRTLRAHLFPGDGKEAVAILLCGRRDGFDRHRLVVHDTLHVPYERCVRHADFVRWPTDVLDDFLARATKSGFGIVKVHSHPTGFAEFSSIDDASDRDLVPSLYAWTDRPEVHGSVIMLPDGSMFGRVVQEDAAFVPLHAVVIVGDDIVSYSGGGASVADVVPGHAERLAQAFGIRTLRLLRMMRVGVVGCSGTGSIVIEQLARNCVGKLVLVDPEFVEDKNLNRIVNAGKRDIGRRKVDVMRDAVDNMGLGTEVAPMPMDIVDPRAVRAVADCDVIFGCVDGAVGRHVLNRIASYYILPYFDVGVKLAVDASGDITRVEASANYIKPGGSSLLSRGLYTIEDLSAEWLKRNDPAEYERRKAERYVKGVVGDQPAVISVNMVAASLGVNDFLARVHRYRDADSANFERQILSLVLGVYYADATMAPCPVFARHVGRGDESPLLGMPEFSERGA